MATFYITKESTCPKCEGSRVIDDPIWAAYWQAVEDGSAGKAYEHILEFFAEYGCDVYGEPLPPEEMACPDCDGRGVVTEKVELSEALRVMTA